MTPPAKTAYLREITHKQQCELSFDLFVDLEDVGVIKQEIKAVRQLTDNVESLLQHISNKIKQIIKTLVAKDATKENMEPEVKVALKNRKTKKHIALKRRLEDLISSGINLKFVIFDQMYFVAINPPFVCAIELPQILYASFKVQPTRFKTVFTDIERYYWYKSKDRVTWEEVATTFEYKIDEKDVDHYLKFVCVPCNSTMTGPSAEVISQRKVELIADLPNCPFEERHKHTMKNLSDNNFRMVSYNVLSQRYLEGTTNSFPYCPLKVLAIDYRKQLITRELLGYNADLMCLQEVDINVYNSYYKGIFKENGYDSFYHRKGNKMTEGLACFFKTSRFRKLDDRQIVYSTEITNNSMFAHLWKFVKTNFDLRSIFKKQMTSLHVTFLKLKIKGKEHFIMIGNTHLFYHPDAELVRVIQIHMAVTYLNFIQKEQILWRNFKVILCGDFNSMPNSAVLEYIKKGCLPKHHEVFKNCKNRIDLCHPFRFGSACGFPKYTNYTDTFKSCLDYIFIEKGKMKVGNVVPFPKDEDLAVYEGLPNEVYPSDHLALIVDLKINSD